MYETKYMRRVLELARPLDSRRIIPMVQNRELAGEARAVYEARVAEADKVTFQAGGPAHRRREPRIIAS